MTHRMHCLHALAWLCALALFVPTTARAEAAYPTRPIHIVIPFPAGGPSDIAARIIAQRGDQVRLSGVRGCTPLQRGRSSVQSSIEIFCRRDAHVQNTDSFRCFRL